MISTSVITRYRLDAIATTFVSVHPHETSALLHSALCFFFILSAYFVVLPLRDEGAISLGLSKLPSLFMGSLVLTLIAAPVSTLVFSNPNISKAKALVLIHRFFSVTLVLFFILWHFAPSSLSAATSTSLDSISPTSEESRTVELIQANPAHSEGWEKHGWFYVSVRIGLFLWIALLNLLTISSTWARVIDVMDSESGSRLFGFIGAGATLGQLFGSLFAAAMAWMGPSLLLFSALLMELAARSANGINKDVTHLPEELSPIRETDPKEQNADGQKTLTQADSPPITSHSEDKPQLGTILDGFWLIISSTYLLFVALFLWLSAVVSSFFYFQKVSVIATTITTSIGRRKLFAEINSFIAIFILVGQLTLTGRILTISGVTFAICAAPVVASLNMVSIAVWPNWVAIAISETVRKVVMYVLTRPGRELLFTVVSQEEKYKAKVCIDVVVQRLGDATAAGMFKLLYSHLNGKPSIVALYALPVGLLWIATAYHVGRRQTELAKHQMVSTFLH